MSHTDEPIICPNCGSEARGNFCYQCGQETHLHKDTFWGLVMHFVGHYFHYDSKFWQTIKTMWTKPGKLTVAYMDRQRMRYIPPISLYICISAVYFLAGAVFDEGSHGANKKKIGHAINVTDSTTIHDDKEKRELADLLHDSTRTHERDSLLQALKAAKLKIDTTKEGFEVDLTVDERDTAGVTGYLNRKMMKVKKEHADAASFFMDKFFHSIPKLFFFMIPILALLLKMIYFRRKDLYFVDHAVFALHYHSFWFSIFLITQLPLPEIITTALGPLCSIWSFVYMVKALRSVYHTGTARSIANTLFIWFGYGFSFFIIALLDFLVILLMA